MATAANLLIAADRVGACVRTLVFRGLDLTGVALAMQVRLAPDTPGAPLIDLGLVTDPAAEGLRFVGVQMDGGTLPVSTVVLRLAEATMKDATKVPYAGELGASARLSYDLIGTFGGDKRRLAFGDFLTVPTVYGSDAAPAGRSAGGVAGTNGIWSMATLTFDSDTLAVTVNGYDLLAPLVAQAQGSADSAEMDRVLANAAAATAVAASGRFFQTKALANAALASLPDQATATVFNDESRGGSYTIYQKVGGAFAPNPIDLPKLPFQSLPVVAPNGANAANPTKAVTITGGAGSTDIAIEQHHLQGAYVAQRVWVHGSGTGKVLQILAHPDSTSETPGTELISINAGGIIQTSKFFIVSGTYTDYDIGLTTYRRVYTPATPYPSMESLFADTTCAREARAVDNDANSFVDRWADGDGNIRGGIAADGSILFGNAAPAGKTWPQVVALLKKLIQFAGGEFVLGALSQGSHTTLLAGTGNYVRLPNNFLQLTASTTEALLSGDHTAGLEAWASDSSRGYRRVYADGVTWRFLSDDVVLS